jgi:hypothetical protein
MLIEVGISAEAFLTAGTFVRLFSYVVLWCLIRLKL